MNRKVSWSIAAFLVIGCTKKSDSIIKSTAPLPGTVYKTDTLRIMAYNVMNYGDYCQGAPASLDPYMGIIIQEAQPDLISCEKMSAFPYTNGASGNLADEMLQMVFNKDSANRFGYASPTNLSGSGSMSVLFYKKQKLTFVNVNTILAYITDFNLYKFYYNDVNLPITRDTTFLYVLVCHTKSGSASTDRDYQDSSIESELKKRFLYFPNLVIMGDFNTTGSYEKGYQSILNSKDDTSRVMSDPPYFPDQLLKYPGNWNTTPLYASRFLSTSTRSLPTVPNDCGTSGGGKGWYDHIFISNWLTNGKNYMKYIGNSYQSFGNDGDRLGVSINSQVPAVNSSLPSNVLDALFYFSDKYPVMLNLVVTANQNGISPKDP